MPWPSNNGDIQQFLDLEDEDALKPVEWSPTGHAYFLDVLALLLGRWVAQSDRRGVSHVSACEAFYSSSPAPISVEAYVTRLARFTKCSATCLLTAYIYVERLVQDYGVPVCSSTVHRLLITATVLAAKFIDDRYYTNKHYAKVGGVAVKELNRMELDMLQLLKYRLLVSLSDLKWHLKQAMAGCFETGRPKDINMRKRRSMGTADGWPSTGPMSPASTSTVDTDINSTRRITKDTSTSEAPSAARPSNDEPAVHRARHDTVDEAPPDATPAESNPDVPSPPLPSVHAAPHASTADSDAAHTPAHRGEPVWSGAHGTREQSHHSASFFASAAATAPANSSHGFELASKIEPRPSGGVAAFAASAPANIVSPETRHSIGARSLTSTPLPTRSTRIKFGSTPASRMVQFDAEALRYEKPSSSDAGGAAPALDTRTNAPTPQAARTHSPGPFARAQPPGSGGFEEMQCSPAGTRESSGAPDWGGGGDPRAGGFPHEAFPPSSALPLTFTRQQLSLTGGGGAADGGADMDDGDSGDDPELTQMHERSVSIVASRTSNHVWEEACVVVQPSELQAGNSDDDDSYSSQFAHAHHDSAPPAKCPYGTVLGTLRHSRSLPADLRSGGALWGGGDCGRIEFVESLIPHAHLWARSHARRHTNPAQPLHASCDHVLSSSWTHKVLSQLQARAPAGGECCDDTADESMSRDA